MSTRLKKWKQSPATAGASIDISVMMGVDLSSVSKLRKTALDLLRIEQAPDLVETREGLLAWNAPWIAELAFLARVNRPLDSKEIDILIDNFGAEFRRPLTEIYESFNGLDMFNGIFSIYGLRTSLLERSDFYNIQNVPFDIFYLNSALSYKYKPDHTLLIATIGYDKDQYVDIIDLKGNISTGKFQTSDKIENKWNSMEEWLSDRYYAALEMYNEEYPENRHIGA